MSRQSSLTGWTRTTGAGDQDGGKAGCSTTLLHRVGVFVSDDTVVEKGTVAYKLKQVDVFYGDERRETRKKRFPETFAPIFCHWF